VCYTSPFFPPAMLLVCTFAPTVEETLPVAFIHVSNFCRGAVCSVLLLFFLHVFILIQAQYCHLSHQCDHTHINYEYVVLEEGRKRRGGGCCMAAAPRNPPKPKFQKHRRFGFCSIKVLRDFPFSRNQPLKSADDQYIRILKNKLIKLKKKQEDRTLWLSHGTCCYIRMYINAAADSVVL
jgi:hypothetical protein